MPQGSIPGPSRLAFSMNNLEEGIDCLLINSAGSLDPGDMENALGDISSLQRYLDISKTWRVRRNSIKLFHKEGKEYQTKKGDPNLGFDIATIKRCD